MRRAMFLCLLAGLSVCLTGCAGEPKYTQMQLNALETREIDAGLTECFNAASNALFDAGYTIQMSDRAGGLLTGSKSHDRKRDNVFVNRHNRWENYTLSVQVRRLNDRLTAIRVKTAINGEPRVDLELIDEFWVLMQRQVLLHEPVRKPAEPE